MSCKFIAPAIATLVLAAGCAELKDSATTAHTPERFRSVLESRYDRARQAEVIDCVNDGLTSSKENILLTHVRQTQRADGVRIDVVAAGSQLIVANVRNDGVLSVVRSDYNGALQFDRQLAAVRGCQERFPA